MNFGIPLGEIIIKRLRDVNVHPYPNQLYARGGMTVAVWRLLITLDTKAALTMWVWSI